MTTITRPIKAPKQPGNLILWSRRLLIKCIFDEDCAEVFAVPYTGEWDTSKMAIAIADHIDPRNQMEIEVEPLTPGVMKVIVWL